METSVSTSEMALVSAANSTSRKNKKPMMVAMPPMSTNTVGSVTNMSEGPAWRHRVAGAHGHEGRRHDEQAGDEGDAQIEAADTHDR